MIVRLPPPRLVAGRVLLLGENKFFRLLELTFEVCSLGFPGRFSCCTKVLVVRGVRYEATNRVRSRGCADLRVKRSPTTFFPGTLCSVSRVEKKKKKKQPGSHELTNNGRVLHSSAGQNILSRGKTVKDFGVVANVSCVTGCVYFPSVRNFFYAHSRSPRRYQGDEWSRVRFYFTPKFLSR